ncbi:unnamed protein product [Porites lobata]|uniref:Uncharacterized protein n=1 Tax=Porites lobata TaxID=104759 RepID=A0ABN8R234_9CNID|nr:unnamed protein product [Porites lobata]
MSNTSGKSRDLWSQIIFLDSAHNGKFTKEASLKLDRSENPTWGTTHSLICSTSIQQKIQKKEAVRGKENNRVAENQTRESIFSCQS